MWPDAIVARRSAAEPERHNCQIVVELTIQPAMKVIRGNPERSQGLHYGLPFR